MNKQESKKLENKITKFLKTHIKKTNCVILGMSGGPDSVFLMKILSKLKNPLKIKIIIAHVNHLLRGREADLDEKFAQKLAKKHKDPFEILKSNVQLTAKKQKKGLEEMGREIRYEFFKDLTKKYKANFVLTAHHADDNLETILMNFARGAHLKGLCGMEECENFHKNTKLLRPLLSIPKSQITDYLKLNKIPYRTDKTNEDTQYKRNFIRHNVIPYLKEINPNLAESVAKNTENIREAYQFLSKYAQEWIEKNSLDKTFSAFNLKTFRKENIALKKQILIELHKLIANTKRDLKKIHIDEVLQILENNLGNKKKKLGKLVIYLKNGIIKILLNK